MSISIFLDGSQMLGKNLENPSLCNRGVWGKGRGRGGASHSTQKNLSKYLSPTLSSPCAKQAYCFESFTCWCSLDFAHKPWRPAFGRHRRQHRSADHLRFVKASSRPCVPLTECGDASSLEGTAKELQKHVHSANNNATCVMVLCRCAFDLCCRGRGVRSTRQPQRRP